MPWAFMGFAMAIVFVELTVYENRRWFADLASWQWEAKSELVESGELDAEIVVFGSSILFHALDPTPANAALMGDGTVANLALNGQTLQHSTQLLRRYTEQNPDLKLVVLELWNLDVPRESWLRGPYYRFWASWPEFFQSKFYFWDPAAVAGFAANRALPSFRYREALDNWLSTCLREARCSQETLERNAAVATEMTCHRGFAHADMFDNGRVSAPDVRVPEAQTWMLSRSADLWLEQFVSHCDQRRLRLVILLPPAPSFVEAGRAMTGFDQQLNAHIDDLRARHPAIEIQVVRFRDYSLGDFADDHHLSRDGRLRLSQDFADWIVANHSLAAEASDAEH